MADRLRRALPAALPVLIALLLLLSFLTLPFAGFIHDAPMLEPGGVISWQAKVELILAFVNFGWVGMLIVAYFLARKREWLVPAVLSLAGFVVNYALWVTMTIEI